MADPRDYIVQAGYGLQSGLESLAANKRKEDYLNTELPEPAQYAFRQMMPTPMRPVAGAVGDLGAAAGEAAGGLGGLAASGNPMQQPSSESGYEHPAIKEFAEKVRNGEIDPIEAAKQARTRFTNRDVEGLKLALDAREQQARMKQAEARGEGLTFEQRLLLEQTKGDYGVRNTELRGGAQRDAATTQAGGRVKAAEVGAGASNYRADRGLEGAKARAEATIEAARERAKSSESIAKTRFGSSNANVTALLKNLKISVEKMRTEGSQLDVLRNIQDSGGGVDADQLRKTKEAYEAARKNTEVIQKLVDEAIAKGGPDQSTGSSTTIQRDGQSGRAGGADFGSFMQQQGQGARSAAPFAIRQQPGQPPPPGMENATPVAGPPPPGLPTRTEVQEPPAAMNAPFTGGNGQPVRAIPRPPMGQPTPMPQPQSQPHPPGFAPPQSNLNGVGDVITRVAYSAKTNTTYFFSGNKVVKTAPGKVQ